ncbi:MAG: hypothetical protein R3C44_15580 [Chloroflexota bacterium]
MQAAGIDTSADVFELRDSLRFSRLWRWRRVDLPSVAQGGSWPGTAKSMPYRTCAHQYVWRPEGAWQPGRVLALPGGGSVTQQIRGEAGDCQVEGAKIGMTQNLGGSGATAVTHVLRVDA